MNEDGEDLASPGAGAPHQAGLSSQQISNEPIFCARPWARHGGTKSCERATLPQGRSQASKEPRVQRLRTQVQIPALPLTSCVACTGFLPSLHLNSFIYRTGAITAATADSDVKNK